MARGPKKPIAAKGNRGKSNPKSFPSSSSSSSVARFNDESDIPMDDQDLFHKQRDQILLGPNDQGDDQEYDDDDAFNGEREILGLDDQMSDDSQESVEEEEEEEEEEVEDSLPTKKKQLKSKEKEKASSASQTKASNYGSVTEDEEEDDDDEEDLDRGWGPNKRSYFGTNNLDNLDSEDSELDEEEARELELNEVKRLQAKSRKGMNDEDFGLGEDGIVLQDYKDESTGKKLGDREKRRLELDQEGSHQVANKDPSASSTGTSTSLPSDPSARSALLAQVQKTSPETIALAGEYADVVEELERVEPFLKKVTEELPNHPSLGLMHLHHQTLVTYVTTIAYYFYLRSLPQYARDPSKLSKHAVLGRLVKLKTALSAMDELGLSADPQSDEEEGATDEEDGELDLHSVDPAEIALPDSDLDSEDLGSLEEDELDGLMDDQKQSQLKEQEESLKKISKSNKGKGKEKADSTKDQDQTNKNKKKSSLKRKAQQEEEPEPAPLSNLADLEDDEDEYQDLSSDSNKKKKKSKKSGNNVTESAFESAQAFGEPTTLSKADQAEKSARKKSLQFYTGQITSKDARREAAAKAKLTGDADIPYRDRDRSREGVNATLANKAAKANGINTNGRGLDDDADDWNEEDKRDWRDVMGVDNDFGEGEEGIGGGDGNDDDDDYYDLVASGKRKAKKQKKEEYEEAREAERYVPDDSLEEGGHRSINRQIEKNRGLTPRRPKAVRNPRVKKRQKFDKASKKLGSIRPVFKGGQSSLQGGYEGEKSGISSHLVKSRSFGK